MIKKMILVSAFVIGLISFSSAQDKTSVGILPFTHTGAVTNTGDVNSIQETVTNAFVKTKRFNIVDRTKIEALTQEKNLQKTEDFIDGKVIQQGVALGANFLVSGHVTAVTKTSKYQERTKLDGTKVNELVNEASISFSCKLIDGATGQVVNSESFSTSGGGNFLGITTASNVEEAFNSSLKSLNKAIDKWVGKNFPVSFQIVEIQEKDSKGNASTLMIAGGSAFGLLKGDKLKVVEVSEIEVGGKKLQRKKEIGELKISKVEDDNFSTCSVKSGGVEINSRFEAKANIQVITEE